MCCAHMANVKESQKIKKLCKKIKNKTKKMQELCMCCANTADLKERQEIRKLCEYKRKPRKCRVVYVLCQYG